MSSQSYTNRLRILAIANNTKVQYTRGIAVNNNPIYSTINCSPNFNILPYVFNRSCKKTCPPSVCYSLPIMDGGNPSSIPTYFVSGGTPQSVNDCVIGGSII